MENLSEDHLTLKGGSEAIVCGVSAGGVDALRTLLAALPPDFSLPLVIVQHLHPQDNGSLVEFLAHNCSLPVREASEKEPVQKGVVFLAPANYHLLIEPDRTFSLSVDEKVNFSRPSIDVLFETAADAYGPALIGVVMTGASHDGAAGLRRIQQRHGITIVQDPATAEYPAMVLAALKAVEADYVLSLEGIGQLLATIGRASVTNRTSRGT